MKREANGMKQATIFAIAAALVGLTGRGALAHDPSQHKAAATHGVVTRASGDAVTVKSNGAETTYALSPDTKVLRGGKPLGAAALKPGTDVAVYATKLPGGKVAATEINLTGTSADRSDHREEPGHEHGASGAHAR